MQRDAGFWQYLTRSVSGWRETGCYPPGGIVLRVRADSERERAEGGDEADADSGAKLRHSLHASSEVSACSPPSRRSGRACPALAREHLRKPTPTGRSTSLRPFPRAAATTSCRA